MIAVLRENAEKTGHLPSLPLPPDTPVAVAVSGGADSTALLLLLARYGRRIVADPRTQLTVLHFNHQWRGAESQEDETFVRTLSAQLGLSFVGARADEMQGPGQGNGDGVQGGESAPGTPNEDAARAQRKSFFAAYLEKNPGAWIFTAHHAGDLAETVLWRLLTGAPAHQEGGIWPCASIDRELRPLLTTPKADLISFLQEEKIAWREDRTNHDGRLLRSALRMKVIPELDRLFPRWADALGERARQRWGLTGCSTS